VLVNKEADRTFSHLPIESDKQKCEQSRIPFY